MFGRESLELTGRRFARILLKRNAHYPISDEHERNHLRGPNWWTNQQEHVTSWLNELHGPGACNRKTRGLGAEHMYNHFQCAPSLPWIAEALEEDPAVVQLASAAAAGLGRRGTQCAAIRRVIPWERINQLARHSR